MSKYELLRPETKVKLPKGNLSLEIKEAMYQMSKVTRIAPGVNFLDNCRDQIRKMINNHKIGSPNLEPRNWYLTIEGKEFSVRYGHKGDPQLILKQINE